jgi:hypothetical protein
MQAKFLLTNVFSNKLVIVNGTAFFVNAGQALGDYFAWFKKLLTSELSLEK